MKAQKLAFCMALMVLVNSGLLLARSAQAETAKGSVGVKAGDWVRYNATCLGSFNVWEDNMCWTKTEVTGTSGPLVSVTETFHYPDDREITRDSGYDLSDQAHAHIDYIVATDLEPGDKIGEACRMVEPNQFVWYDLVINNTESRTYGGITRVVYHMAFSDTYSYPEGNFSITADRYWDAETGFLLEYVKEGHWLGYEEYYKTHLPSTYRVEIADTNLWETQRSSLQSWLLLILAPTGLAVLTTAIRPTGIQAKREGEGR